MGKLMTFITIIIFVDLLFIITGQISGTFSSAVFNAALSPDLIQTSSFWTGLLGTSGILALAISTGAFIGFLFTKQDTLLFIGIAGFLATFVGDFVVLYQTLKAQQPILAVIVVAPIIILYVLTVLEWLRGKD